MTEEQTKIVEAYLEQVGEDVVTKKDITTWSKWSHPVHRGDEKKLKRDTGPFKGIVPAFTKPLLPAVEYRYV